MFDKKRNYNEDDTDDTEYHYPKLEEMQLNYVTVSVYSESGCDPKKGEYNVYLVSFSKPFLTDGDTIDKVEEAILENIDKILIADECMMEVVLKESGEWEGFNWNSWFEIERIVRLDI